MNRRYPSKDQGDRWRLTSEDRWRSELLAGHDRRPSSPCDGRFAESAGRRLATRRVRGTRGQGPASHASGAPQSLAIFFDTIRNSEIGDPSGNYIAICTAGRPRQMKWPPPRLAYRDLGQGEQARQSYLQSLAIFRAVGAGRTGSRRQSARPLDQLLTGREPREFSHSPPSRA